MITGFEIIQNLASKKSLVIPRHDPVVTQAFPSEGNSGYIWRLDKSPTKPIQGI